MQFKENGEALYNKKHQELGRKKDLYTKLMRRIDRIDEIEGYIIILIILVNVIGTMVFIITPLIVEVQTFVLIGGLVEVAFFVSMSLLVVGGLLDYEVVGKWRGEAWEMGKEIKELEAEASGIYDSYMVSEYPEAFGV